ncbi:PrpF domain-containing protein [Lentzea nigeriaca]|uniref:PrpF domain-containing protein n=1 Tax=Lentzea nigeriaca TaxID=1128665 RepID=UPI00195BFAD9|nr:PrpF domain-containing protein [Lentzea nigeriaca]MBM7856323.1 2-methylaconitate cis-trans-isomerase PrpF [Lentzea nigeriaca]
MIAHLAFASGSPCPTLVLDARYLPAEDGPLLAALADARRWLTDAGGGHVLKIALIQPSAHPLLDLDYRFIQALPDGPDRFDLRGSCGHSVLSSITAAAECGMLPKLGPGDRVRVNVLNNGDHLVCEVDSVGRTTVGFTVHFLQIPPRPLTDLLLVGTPRTTLRVDGRDVEVSLVSAGNPYVFVSAAGARVRAADELFADDAELFDRLVRIRRAAAEHLGWSPDGAFPKVAVTLPLDGMLAVRAISVPTWHPTLALTGVACLGAATGIPGTIPWLTAREASCAPGMIHLRTPGAVLSVTAATTTQDDGVTCLNWTTVGDKRVTFHGSFFLEPLAHFQLKEIAECLSLPA